MFHGELTHEVQNLEGKKKDIDPKQIKWVFSGLIKYLLWTRTFMVLTSLPKVAPSAPIGDALLCGPTNPRT
jgi:hypothetical protein